MNNYIKNSLRIGIIAAAGAAAMVSCTDTWDDHYDSATMSGFNGTTMQAIEKNAPDFAAVIKAVGFDRELNSDNVYTVWAPMSFNKDSILEVAKKDSAAVVDRFIKNHIARYAISDNGTDQHVELMSLKTEDMTGDHTFGHSQLVEGKTNIACHNGVLHMIDKSIDYTKNIYELIHDQYALSTTPGKEEQGGSLYAFLQKFNADSLDESRSVSRGVDENGEKIWVDSVVIRNNTALKNMDALVYEEDSSYIAIIPSEAAFQKRYKTYKKLLQFNPIEDTKAANACDSLQNYYANMFAMEDLFFNINANEHMEDSLKSTSWRTSPVPYGVYYRKDKKNQPAERPTHDILAGLDPIECSNGVAYLVDEYPMDAMEQSFRKLTVSPGYLSEATDAADNELYTKDCSEPKYIGGMLTDYKVDTIYNDDGEVLKVDSTFIGTRNYTFYDFEPSNSTKNPFISFYIPNILSGTHELYLVTCPIWAKTGFNNGEKLEDDPRGYRFYTYVWERESDGKNLGSYPATGKRLTPPLPGEVGSYGKGAGLSEKNFYMTDPTEKIDTLYLGDYTFKNTYYSRGYTEEAAGAMIQFNTQITSKQTSTYSREMLISKVILKPKFTEADLADDDDDEGDSEAK